MDFWEDLINTLKDYFSTTSGQIVLIVIVLTAIITALANHVVPKLGKLAWHLPRSIWRVSQMLKKKWQDWWYWKRFGPKYSLSPIGRVNVEPIRDSTGAETGSYRISFRLIFECQNRDNLSNLFIDCRRGQQDMYFKLKAKHFSGRTKPYFVTYREGDIVYSVRAGANSRRIYLLDGAADAKPVLGTSVRCEAIYFAYAQVAGIGKLMKVAPFDIEVNSSELISQGVKA